MRPIVKILTAALIFVSANAARAQDDGDTALDDIPHITIVGTAETDATPDIATITLGVTMEKPTAAAAAAENARKAQRVIDTAKARGVAQTEIATQSVNLTQTFDDLQDPQGRLIAHKPRGFAAVNLVTIKVHDLTKAGALAEALIENGANRFDGINFSVDHPEPILDKLTGEAVRQARTQAQIAAEAAGVRLGRVLLIRQPGEQGRPATFRFSSGAQMAEKAMPIEPGTTHFARQIEVTWAIEPK